MMTKKRVRTATATAYQPEPRVGETIAKFRRAAGLMAAIRNSLKWKGRPQRVAATAVKMPTHSSSAKILREFQREAGTWLVTARTWGEVRVASSGGTVDSAPDEAFHQAS